MTLGFDMKNVEFTGAKVKVDIFRIRAETVSEVVFFSKYSIGICSRIFGDFHHFYLNIRNAFRYAFSQTQIKQPIKRIALEIKVARCPCAETMTISCDDS